MQQQASRRRHRGDADRTPLGCEAAAQGIDTLHRGDQTEQRGRGVGDRRPGGDGQGAQRSGRGERCGWGRDARAAYGEHGEGRAQRSVVDPVRHPIPRTVKRDTADAVGRDGDRQHCRTERISVVPTVRPDGAPGREVGQAGRGADGLGDDSGTDRLTVGPARVAARFGSSYGADDSRWRLRHGGPIPTCVRRARPVQLDGHATGPAGLCDSAPNATLGGLEASWRPRPPRPPRRARRPPGPTSRRAP